MAQPQLRVVFGSDDSQTPTPSQSARPAKDMVSATLGEIIGPLTDAVSSQRNWVQDFANDELLISSDLYEVIMAYADYRREAA